MNQSIALNVRTPQPDLAAITRAAQDANLNDYQLRNAPAKSELEGLQLQSQIGGEKAMAGYREAVGRGDPNALKQLDGQPQMQAQMYAAFDGMSPQEFMEAKKRATAFGKAAQFVGPMIDGTPEQEQRWNASAKVLKDAGMIDDAQFNMMIESGPNELMIQQAMTTDEWVKAYGGPKDKGDKSPEMKGLEIDKIRAEIEKINRTGADDETSKLKLDLLEAQIARINAQTESEKTGDKKTTAAEIAEKGRNLRAARKEIGEFAAEVMKRAYTPEQKAAAEAAIAKKREEVMDAYGLSNESEATDRSLAPTGAADPTVPPGAAPGEEASPQAAIPQGAIDMLKKDPTLAAKFDEKYGVGAAESVMGGSSVNVNPFDQFDSAPAVGASPPNPFDQFDETAPTAPPFDPRFPYSADNPPPVEKSRNAPYPTPDMPGATTITGTGAGMANPKREAELNALYGEPAPFQPNPFDQFDAVADPSYTGEAGKAFVRGAAQTIGSAGKGLSRLTSDDKRKVETVEAGIAGLASMTPEEATQFVRSIPEAMDISPAAALNYQMAARALWKGDKAKADGYLKTARSLTDTRPLKDQQLYQQSEEFNKSFDTPDWKPAPGWEDALTVQIANALGTTAAFLPVGLASGGTGVAAFGGAMSTDQQGQGAEDQLRLFRAGNDATRSNNRAHGRLPSPFVGLSPEDVERLVAREAKLGFLPGASENAPIELLLDQTARRIPGLRNLVNTPFWGQYKRVAGRIILQGMTEGGQEGGQTIASNLISQFMTNPNQTWDEGAAHNALIGAVVGVGMQGAQEVGSAVMPQAAPEAAPAVQAPPPPPPGPATRVEPNLFVGPPKGPDDDGGGGGGPDTSSSVLVQSGYTAEDIADMNPTERAAAVRSVAGEQAVMPAELPRPPIAPPESAPEVGTAQMAPRQLAPQNTPNPFDQFDEALQPSPPNEVDTKNLRKFLWDRFDSGYTHEEVAKELKARGATDDALIIAKSKFEQWSNEDEAGTGVTQENTELSDPSYRPPVDVVANEPKSLPKPVPAVRAPIMRRDMEDDSAVTSSGRDVPVKYAVVEASDLVASQLDDGGANPQYPAELQPRDRERAVSQQQVQDIATRLDPRLLDKSPKASDGSPIIAADGTVESGNGRVLAIRRAYKQNGEAAKRYRDHLAAQGYPVGDVREPVLVRVRQGEMAAEDRQAFTREANERDTLGMSATERAMADAAALPENVTALYRGGDVESAGNREFVRAFIRDVVGKNDQANLIAGDGTLSQEAIRRVEAALLGKAYGDADLVASLVESPDSNIKAIGGALMNVAPAWAQMRAEAKAGTIDKDADQTERLLEAVRLVQRARREEQPLALLVGQNDIFSGATLHPTAEFFLSLMFHDTQRWKQPMGREKLAAALQFYVEEERKTSSGFDLLGETAAKPSDILALAKRKQENGSQATSTDQSKLDLAQRPRADNGKDAGNAGERGTTQTAPRAEAAPSPEVAGDGRGKPELAEDENEVSQSRNYHPLNSFIPHEKTNLGGRAKEYVLRRGKEKGAEVLLAFDGEGNVVSDGYGSPKTVEPSELHNQMNNDPASKIVVHHNHPSSSSFSAADITMLAKPGAAVIWAHGTDGHSYRATLNPELRAATDPSYLGNMLWYMLRRNMGVIYDVLQGRVTDEKISVDTAQLLLTHYRNLALHRAGITDYFTTKEFAPDTEIEQAVEETAAFLRRTLADEDITIGRSAKSIRYLGDMGVLAEGNRDAAGGRSEAPPERGSGRNNRGKEKGQRLDAEDNTQFTPPANPSPNLRPEDGLFLGKPSAGKISVATLKEDVDEFKTAPFKRSSPRKGQPALPTSFDPLHDQPLEAWADDTLRYWGAGQKIDQMVRAAALEKYTTLKDRHVAISRLVEAIERRIGKALPDQMNPFLASRLFAGRMPEAVRVFEETRVKPLVDAMAKRKITPAELGQWLQARHVEERNNHLGQSFDPGDPFYEAVTDPSIIGASGWSQNEADAVLEKVRRSGRSADFEQVADLVYQINDEALALRLKAGLMDQESYDRIASTYEFYVPHQGFEAEPDNADFIPGIGLGFDLRAPEFRRALGRRSKADNPLTYVVSSAKKGIIRAEKARVDRSMLLVAQTYPNPELYQIDKVETKRVARVDAQGNTSIQEARDRGADQADNVLVVKIGGKARRITFTEGKGDRLARAFKNLEVPQLGPFVRFMHTLNRMWAQLNTSRSPEFLTKNFNIDSITALININAEGKAKAALTMVRTVARAMRGMNRHLKGKHDTVWANHAADYAAHGGKMEYLGLIGIENEKKMFERLYKQRTERVPMTKKALWDATMGRLERWNDALENAWRLSAYVALVKHGISKDRAAQAARDLTVDFSVHGEYGPNINAFYAFFNATAEGQINIIKRYVYNRHTRRVFNGLILLGFTQTLLNYWIADDDDDGEDRYAKIPDFVKLNNFVFMAPSWVPEKYKPKSGYYTYPARGWNIFHVIGQMAAETVVGDRGPTEAASIIATSLVNFANPMGNSGLSLNTLAPTMLDPFVDVATNKNYMGSEIVPGAGKYDKRPQSERYRNTTSDAFVYPAKKLNELTGGSDERSGAIDISPEVLEHWYEFVTGGVGRLLSRSWNTIENVVDGTSLDPEKLPFARLYFGQDQSFEDRKLYYKIKDAVETTERELKAREEEGDFKAAEAVAKKYWRETQIIEAVNDVEKELAGLRKEKREMQKNLEVDEATRRAVIKDIDAQMDTQMLDIRRLWNTLRKQKVTE